MYELQLVHSRRKLDGLKPLREFFPGKKSALSG